MNGRVAIVGGGYAGLACAVELTDAGIDVDLFEASRTLGGRARAVTLGNGVVVDNGPHILVGAYRTTLALMRRVGADIPAALLRHPLRLDYPDEFLLRAPSFPLPAPLPTAWALLTARGLTLREKLAAVRFMRAMQACDYQLAYDIPVQELLLRQRQPPRLIRYLWEPLCVAALNTPGERASAQVFLNVLRDSLDGAGDDADLLLPRQSLSQLFPEPAARHLDRQGANLHRGTRIDQLTRHADGFRLDGQGPFADVVLAVAPYHLPPLLAGFAELASLRRQVEAMNWEPIIGAYLAYPPQTRLPFAMCGVADGCAHWLIDRGATHGQAGLIAAVISAREDGDDHDELARRIHKDIARLVPGLAAPLWHQVIVEHRATFACTPGLVRPPMATAVAGLRLAGDYVAGDYPATLEGAVRSGVAAARSILQQKPAGQT